MLTLILYAWCLFGGASKPLDFYAGYRNLAMSMAKYIENDKKVVVLNFASTDPNAENKTTQLDIYLAKYLTTYLLEASGNRFKVVDRKLGEATFAEDMKYEIQRRRPEEVLKDFQCDYYLTGKYILRNKKIDFVEISLNRGPIKEFSVSKTFKLTEEQNNDFKGISQEDIIVKFIKKLIEDLKTKTDPVSIFLVGVLERLLEEYEKSKTGDSEIFNIAKEALLKFLQVQSFIDKTQK